MHNLAWPSWDDLQYVLALQRHGRLASAADALGVRHTTVARRIAQLEDQLGKRVFEKYSDGYRLTDSGEMLLRMAEQMEAVAARGFAELMGAKDGGRVRVTMAEANAIYLVLPQIRQFRETHPQIHLELLVDDGLYDLNRGEADIAIRDSLPRQPDLVGIRLGSFQFALFGAESYLERNPVTSGKKGISKHEFIFFNDPLFWWEEGSKHWLAAELAQSRKKGLILNSLVAVTEACRAGLGLAVLPVACAQAQPGIRQVLADPVAQYPAVLVYRSSQRQSPAIQKVIEFLTEVFGNRIPK